MTFDRPVGLLCDRHSIPILLCIEEHGTCTKMKVYENIGRNANIPSKIQALADAGLVDIMETGRADLLSLTGLGCLVVGRIHDIDDAMSAAQEP